MFDIEYISSSRRVNNRIFRSIETFKWNFQKSIFDICHSLIRRKLQIVIETYGEFSPSIKTCEYWFRRFRSDDFEVTKTLRTAKKMIWWCRIAEKWEKVVENGSKYFD